MDLNTLIDHGAMAAGSGAMSFFAAFLRFKQRLKFCEDTLKVLVGDHERLRDQQKAELQTMVDNAMRDLRHRQELVEAREQRGSYPDLAASLREDLHQLQEDVEKLKESRSRFVSAETFASHAQQQEELWRTFERTLGRIEGSIR